MNTTLTARNAIYAARHRRAWGLYATRRWCEIHGIPLSLYRLACQLEATASIDRRRFGDVPILCQVQAS